MTKQHKRKGISKSLRFEIFKRDKFTCQYCGEKAPNAALHIDHIHPVAEGGEENPLNLITACANCNLGKGRKLLSDTTKVDRQRKNLEELQDRRDQIEMLLTWQKELSELEKYKVDEVAAFWEKFTTPYQLSAKGIEDLKKILKKYEIENILEAMRLSAEQYIELQDDNKPTLASIKIAWSRVGGILKTQEIEKEKPYIRDLFYIRGIARNRLSPINEGECLQVLEVLHKKGVKIETLKQSTLSAIDWRDWRRRMKEILQEAEEDVYNKGCALLRAQNLSGLLRLCREELNPASPHVNHMLSMLGWKVVSSGSEFHVDLQEAQEDFANKFHEWRANFHERCIYPTDLEGVYDIGLEFLKSEDDLNRWIHQIQQKSWHSPALENELREIFRDPYFKEVLRYGSDI